MLVKGGPGVIWQIYMYILIIRRSTCILKLQGLVPGATQGSIYYIPLISGQTLHTVCIWLAGLGDRFKKSYELLNARALKISSLYESHFFPCMYKIFCVEFQRVPLKFHTKYFTHSLKDKDFIKGYNYNSDSRVCKHFLRCPCADVPFVAILLCLL